MTDITNINDITQQSNSNTQTNESTGPQNNITSGKCVYDKYGRSPDRKTICGIGLPSAGADSGSGYQKCVFENKCPHCGNATLRWGWHWEENGESAFAGEGGNAEGHFFCYQGDGGCDADYSAQGHEHINGSTYDMTMISGPTPSTEEEAQQLIEGKMPCDGFSSGDVSSSYTGGGSGVLISDKTFYGLIKQIVGAIDGVFIIANNMAYLLSFKDFYEYRNQYDNFIPIIETKDVLRDSLVKNWSTDGYYNAVEVTYADGIIKYQNDALVKQYGENLYYYDFPEDDRETAEAKAQALLASHVRDYSTNIQLSIFYDENINEGSWVKVNKTLTQVSGKTRKEIEQDKLKKQSNKISTKHKGITIENITEKTIIENHTTKVIQTITDEEGNQFDVEIDKSEYELFFVQSYTCRWDKHNSLIMDLELKYGPDTPEDPINATVGSIGVASTGGNISVGGEAADINEFVKKALQGVPNDEMSKVQAIFNAMVSIIRYDFYQCSNYHTPSECLQNASHLNCADSSRLGRACYAAAGLKAKVVSGPGHYWVEVQANGEWIGSDVTGPQGGACVRGLNEIYNGLTKTGECGDEPSC